VQEKQHTSHRGMTLLGLGTPRWGAPSAELCEESSDAAVTGRQLQFWQQQAALSGFKKTVLAFTFIQFVIVLSFFLQVAVYSMKKKKVYTREYTHESYIYKCSMLHYTVQMHNWEI